MLFYDEGLGQWNARDVAKISPARSGTVKGAERTFYIIEFRDGQQLSVLEAKYKEVLRVPLHVWPALPGYSVISGSDGDGAVLQPVLAWAVTLGSSVMPITVAGVNAGVDGALPVLHPDGRVQMPGAATYGTLDDYLAAQRG